MHMRRRILGQSHIDNERVHIEVKWYDKKIETTLFKVNAMKICVFVRIYIIYIIYQETSFHKKEHTRLTPGFVTRLPRRVPLVEQKLLTLPEHLSSPPVFCEVRVTRSFVLCVCFVDCCLSFCPFSFGHCVVCSSPIYGF